MEFLLGPITQWINVIYESRMKWTWHHSKLYTGAATFVPPLCDNKTCWLAAEGTKEAERLPWSFKGGIEDVQSTPWSPWILSYVQNSRTKVAEVAHRLCKRGRRKAHIVYQFERCFCLPCLWPTNSVHWAITVTTTVPPFDDHGDLWATMAMVLPLLCTTCCATTAVLVVEETHKGRAAAVTQKMNFLGLGDRWASWSIFWSLKGGTKVAALYEGAFK